VRKLSHGLSIKSTLCNRDYNRDCLFHVKKREAELFQVVLTSSSYGMDIPTANTSSGNRDGVFGNAVVVLFRPNYLHISDPIEAHNSCETTTKVISDIPLYLAELGPSFYHDAVLFSSFEGFGCECFGVDECILFNYYLRFTPIRCPWSDKN
jgi:hypothetical protein